ncbi:MAG TPA: helix-turn-helix domain-containing protein, partial [Dehalococcoidia bacterium]|nr:helix-turn-helix domain-containing protein [Dehalococcoidia bacterium]
MVTDETAFSALLRRYRGAAGLTQETLAERTGLSARGISDLERGVNERPRRETARLLADALNLTAEQRQDFQQAALLRNRTPLAREQAAEVETNLPATLTSFVGRASELVTLSTMLQRQDVRLLTLTGSGGVGKTRLALELAAANARHFPDGVFLIELAPLRDASLAPVAVARALEIQLPDQKPVVERLQEFFRRKRLLLLLDNFEHLLEAAPVLPQLLSSAPGLKCLVTSRAVLRVSGEHEFAVTPLLVPQLLYLPDSATLRQTPAVDLFVQRAQAANPDFEMTDANGAALAEICVRLDGLPLAIELAAARAKLLSPESLVTRLDNRLQLLVGGPRDLPPRQRTLVGTLAWSYDLLDLLEQRLFRWLSVFAGGWTLATAAALCADECDAAVRTFDGLASLADNSLVQTQSHADGGDRFLMLETIREYAAERLRVSGEEGAARDRHAQVFLDLAEESERRFQGAGRTAWGRVIVGEQENMRAALGWLLDGVKAELAQKLAGNLYWFWDAVGRPGEGRRWAEAALALPGGETPGVPRAAALFTAGGFAWQQGDLSAARARLIE